MSESSPAFLCNLCSAEFPSRNSLFKHLKAKPSCTSKLSQDNESLQSFTSHATLLDLLLSKEEQVEDVYLFVFGGRLRGRTLATIERFSFRRQVWEGCTRMILHRGSHAAATSQSLSFLSHSISPDHHLQNQNQNQNQDYDQNSIVLPTSMPLFVMGGGGMRSNLVQCEKFDPTTMSWSQIAPMKVARHAHACTTCSISVPRLENSTSTTSSSSSSSSLSQSFALKHFVFALGGWINGSLCTPSVEKYDIEANKWSTMTPMNTPRKLFGVATLHTCIRASMDDATTSTTSTTTNANVTANANNTVDSVNTFCASDESVSTTTTTTTTTTTMMVVAEIFVFGGNLDGRDNGKEGEWYTDSVESSKVMTVYTSRGQEQTGDSTKSTKNNNNNNNNADNSSSSSSSNSDSSDDCKVEIGPWINRPPLPFPGPCSAIAVDEQQCIYVFIQGKGVWRFDPAANVYTKKSPLPLPDWFCFDATRVGEQIYVSGGKANGDWCRALFMYDTRSDSWTELPSMRLQRRRCAAAVTVVTKTSS